MATCGLLAGIVLLIVDPRAIVMASGCVVGEEMERSKLSSEGKQKRVC
jgi:hypothetical protein